MGGAASGGGIVTKTYANGEKYVGAMKDGKPHQFLKRSSSSLTRQTKINGLNNNKKVNNFLGNNSSLRKSSHSRQGSEKRGHSASKREPGPNKTKTKDYLNQ